MIEKTSTMRDKIQNIIAVVGIILLSIPFFAEGLTVTTSSSVTGELSVTGALSKGGGTFVIDHPLDPENKLLFHSFVESPDAKNMYDGIVTLNAQGEARVTLPWYFKALNVEYRYLATPIGNPSPNLYIKKEVGHNTFTIAGGVPGTRVSWQITGIRQDPYILANPINVEVEKGPDQLVEKGEYLFPELYTNTQ
jgi:hypothetical protein